MINKKLFILMFVMIVLVGSVSAFQFDNKLTYENNDMKIKIKNAFGLGKDLGTAELKSHNSVNHILEVQYGGEFVTMYYDFKGWKTNKDGLGEVIFTDQRTGKVIERDYTFVEWKEVEKENMVDVCDFNGKDYTNCRYESQGTKMVWEWVEFKDKNIKNKRIGIKTYVEKDDWVDGVWIIEGKKIKKHAEWTADLNVGLLRNYDLEDLTENITGDDLTNFNSVTFTAGKIGLGADGGSSNSDKTLNVSSNWDINGNTTSFSVWIKPTGEPTGDDGFMGQCNALTDTCFSLAYSNSPSNEIRWHRIKPGVADTQIRFTQDLGTGTFFHIVGTYDGTNLYLFIDGVFADSLAATGTGSSAQTDRAAFLKDIFAGTAHFNGVVDIGQVWGINLTQAQVTQINNEGNGLGYQNVFFTSPNITLDSPTNNTNFTINNIIMNATIFDNTNISNVTLYLNDIGNETNSTEGLNNTLWTFNIFGIEEGDTFWTMEACDPEGLCSNASQRLFSIDTSAPIINLTRPLETISLQVINTNLTVNWTIIELNPDTCLLQYEGVNNTVNCFDNSTEINITNAINRTTIFYANDTFGGENSTSKSWNYEVFDYDNYTFDSEVVEGTTQEFIGFFNIEKSFTEILFYYNNTQYETTINSLGENDYRLVSSLRVPNVVADINKTFFWSIVGSTINTTAQNQTVLSINADDCSVHTFVLMNHTLLDEETEVIIDNENSSIEVDLQLFPSESTTAILDFSNTYTGTPYAPVCTDINLTGELINLYSQTRYTSDDYVAEFYNIQKQWINETILPINVSIFNLLADDSTEFEITYKSATFLPVPDAIVTINRKYVGQGIFKSVEIPLTDANGKTKGNFDLNGILYQFIVSKDGTVLAIFNNPTIFCDNELSGDCKIILNELSGVEELTTMTKANNLLYELSRDDRTITLDFVVPSGSSRTINFIVNKQDRFLNNTQCNETLVSSSGSIDCVIPESLGDVFVDVFIKLDGDLLVTGSSTILEDRDGIFQGNNIILTFFLILALTLMMLSSPIVVLVGLILGIMTSGLMLLTTSGSLFGATSVVLFILSTVMVLVIKMARKQEG